jgi:hypothetical protein
MEQVACYTCQHGCGTDVKCTWLLHWPAKVATLKKRYTSHYQAQVPDCVAQCEICRLCLEGIVPLYSLIVVEPPVDMQPWFSGIIGGIADVWISRHLPCCAVAVLQVLPYVMLHEYQWCAWLFA